MREEEKRARRAWRPNEGRVQMAEFYRNQRLGEGKRNAGPQSGRLQEARLTEKFWAEPLVLSDSCTKCLRDLTIANGSCLKTKRVSQLLPKTQPFLLFQPVLSSVLVQKSCYRPPFGGSSVFFLEPQVHTPIPL